MASHISSRTTVSISDEINSPQHASSMDIVLHLSRVTCFIVCPPAGIQHGSIAMKSFGETYAKLVIALRQAKMQAGTTAFEETK
ncbi:hypothetical protein RRG08_006847 [Elysia crispata]|uniref:Uncharacterized protein n=1 Tax=Elysia crispata TaxID=231223 RepID=A0AAE1CN95_9GAST|nr:hypothetical protein RRG08_006847 [Elysia crispata]